jgi:hypothetical protein
LVEIVATSPMEMAMTYASPQTKEGEKRQLEDEKGRDESSRE